jgi:hypothetical protein
MSDAMDPTVRHPDELLAGYVDGSATPDEREAVEQHLPACAACQEEVQLATEARAALISLPELGAPGLAEAGVLALRRAAFQAVPTDQPDGATGAEAAPSPAPGTVPAEPRSRRSRLAWAQLAAAAAIVVVLGGLVAIPLLLSNGGSKASRTSPNGAVPSPAANLPVLVDRGANYSQASLDNLAAQITSFARDVRPAPLVGGQRENTQSPTFAPAVGGPADSTVQDSSAAGAAFTCLINGGGPPDNAQPLYLEQAEVSGTPAYVGGFFIPGAKLNVMVIAVTRDGCQPLYSVRQST